MKKLITASLAAILAPAAHAAVLNLYSDASDFAGISEIKSGIDGDGDAYIVENYDTTGTINTGDGLRLGDYSGDAAGTAADKPEAWWDLASTIPAEEGFRLDLSAAILNVDTGTQDINLRFGNNSTGRPTSSSRTWTTISFEQDGSLKVDGSTTDDFLLGALAMSFIVNTSSTSNLTYFLNGSLEVVAPLSIDTWVDGVLVDTDEPMSVGGSIVQADGINEVGFTGSSDAAQGMDFVFDDITLYTGNSIPEPSSSLLSLAAIAGLGMRRRRK